LCKVAGVPEIACHGLRHSTAELWMEQGATEEDIRALLTQKHSSTTRRYMHRSSDRLHQMAKLVVGDPIENQPEDPQPNDSNIILFPVRKNSTKEHGFALGVLPFAYF